VGTTGAAQARSWAHRGRGEGKPDALAEQAQLALTKSATQVTTPPGLCEVSCTMWNNSERNLTLESVYMGPIET
jgi:hypothetical protein